MSQQEKMEKKKNGRGKVPNSEPSLLRDLLKHGQMRQKDLAHSMDVSESLMCYWCDNSTAAAARLGGILKHLSADAEELKKLLKKYLP